ncbi:MAG: hypothetical protein ACRC2S_12345 [Waterburya sp.]
MPNPKGECAIGHTVLKNACRGDATGIVQMKAVRSSWQPMSQESLSKAT